MALGNFPSWCEKFGDTGMGPEKKEKKITNFQVKK